MQFRVYGRQVPCCAQVSCFQSNPLAMRSSASPASRPTAPSHWHWDVKRNGFYPWNGSSEQHSGPTVQTQSSELESADKFINSEGFTVRNKGF